MNKSLLIYIFLIVIWTNVQAISSSLTLVCSDTLPTSTYDGYRLYISNIGIYQVKSNWMRIQYVATNTGSQAIEMNKRKPLPNLDIRFDESLETNHLEDYADQIRKALVLQKIDLAPGEQTAIEYVKFYTNAAKYQQEEVIAEIVEKAPSTQVIRTLPPSKNSRTRKTAPKNEKATTKGLSSSSASLPTQVSTEDLLKEKENCPDLVIEDVNIINQTKKHLILEYTITNQGKGKANLFGENKGREDNAAVVAYMSGSTTLSRGAINLKGEYITDGTGILAPTESQKGTIKLDIRTQTRYTPVIILSLDAFRTAKECDRTNNTTHIIVR